MFHFTNRSSRFSRNGLVRIRVAILAIILGSTLMEASQFHVTTNGTGSASGSISNSWSLSYALSNSSGVHPGDTIWIHEGVYKLSTTLTSTLQGSSTRPIIVRSFNNQRVTLEGKSAGPIFAANSSYTWYWGLEVTCASTDTASGGGNVIAPGGPGNKFINCVVHDGLYSGFSDFMAAENTEIYGCIVYFNGRTTAAGPGFAYGIYAQQYNGVKTYENNLIMHSFGDYGVHLYGTGAATLDSFRIAHNAIINSVTYPEVLVGGGSHNPRGILIDSNFFCRSGQYWGNIEWHEFTDLDAPKIRGNRFMHGALISRTGTTGRVFTGNVLWGANPTGAISKSSYPNNSYYVTNDGFVPPATRPSPTEVFVLPNKYEKKRAHIIVCNWDTLNAVSVDVSGVLHQGDPYVILDGQDYYGTPVASGVYNGSNISLPMTGTSISKPVTYPLARGKPQHTNKEFGAFVLCSGLPGTMGGIPEVHLPSEYKLGQNYPNPFNPSTTIDFSLPSPGNTTVKIYSLLGAEVATLLSENLRAGTYSINWNAIGLPSGTYFYRLVSREFVSTKKMLLLK